MEFPQFYVGNPSSKWSISQCSSFASLRAVFRRQTASHLKKRNGRILSCGERHDIEQLLLTLTGIEKYSQHSRYKFGLYWPLSFLTYLMVSASHIFWLLRFLGNLYPHDNQCIASSRSFFSKGRAARQIFGFKQQTLGFARSFPQFCCSPAWQTAGRFALHITLLNLAAPGGG